MGNVARSIQAEMSHLLNTQKQPSPSDVKRIIGINQQLISMGQQPTEDQNTEIREVQFKAKVLDNELMHIIVLENDLTLAEDISHKLSSARFEISIISSISKIRPYFKHNTSCISANFHNLNNTQNTQLNYTRWLHAINSLTERQLQQKYRVLIIDDQKYLSDYYASILKTSDFLPDLILLDLYRPFPLMTYCSQYNHASSVGGQCMS